MGKVQGRELLSLILVVLSLNFKCGEAQSKSFMINYGASSSVNVNGRKWIGDLTPDNNLTLSSPGDVPTPDIPPLQMQLPSPARVASPVRPPPVKSLKQPKAKDPNKREMCMEEKQKLGMGLQSLPREKMDNVVQIIKKRNEDLRQNGDEIELDIAPMDTETL